ncbi:P22 phage major capsid protein family protein [Streptomyces sp. CO7]
MALDNFIPELWAREALFHLDKRLVWAQTGVVNRDYEGEIAQQGDTVHINRLGPVTVGTYTKNTPISDPEVLTSDQRNLVIDQAKYFNFMIDDIDAAQVTPKLMGPAMERASYGLAKVVDSYVASLAVAGADAANIVGGTTAVDLSASGAVYEQLVDMGTLLDNQDVPEGQRWLIAPPAFVNALSKDQRFNAHSGQSAEDIRRNGFHGEAAGFYIMKSTNSAANTAVMGTPQAISFAAQIPPGTMEPYRPEKYFADAVKGLTLYGGKVIEPKALAVLKYDLSA